MTQSDESGGGSAGRQRDPIPRWVIGFMVVGGVLVALVVVLLALGHGPGQHMSSDTTSAAAALARSGR